MEGENRWILRALTIGFTGSPPRSGSTMEPDTRIGQSEILSRFGAGRMGSGAPDTVLHWR